MTCRFALFRTFTTGARKVTFNLEKIVFVPTKGKSRLIGSRKSCS